MLLPILFFLHSSDHQDSHGTHPNLLSAPHGLPQDYNSYPKYLTNGHGEHHSRSESPRHDESTMDAQEYDDTQVNGHRESPHQESYEDERFTPPKGIIHVHPSDRSVTPLSHPEDNGDNDITVVPARTSESDNEYHVRPEQHAL